MVEGIWLSLEWRCIVYRPVLYAPSGAYLRRLWFVGLWSMVRVYLVSAAMGETKQIAVKEHLPIIIAAAIWGHPWGGQQVICRCDNAAVVAIINSRRSRERDLMQLLRCLFFIEAYFQFQLSAVYLPGEQNVQADDLSRNRLSAFHEKVPEASSLPSPIPPTLLQWLLHPHLDWTSATWIQLFTSSVVKG